MRGEGERERKGGKSRGEGRGGGVREAIDDKEEGVRVVGREGEGG